MVIKVNTAFLFVAILFPSIAFTQKFSFGAKAGVLTSYTNFGEQPGKENFSSDVKLGYSVAGLIGFPLKNRYSFVAEAGFTQQGRKYTYKPNGDSWNSTYYFTEFSMALRKNFKLKIKENINTDWFVNFGPNINYWLGGQGSMDPYFGIHQSYAYIFDKVPDQSYTNIYLNNINRWMFGLNFGIGFTATTLKNQKILAELRMTWGQTYLGQQNSESLGGTPHIMDEMSLKCNLKVLNLSVAYIFDKDIQKSRMGKSTKKVK